MSGSVGDNTARASGVIASAGGGAILQVKSVEFTGTASNSSSTPAAFTGFDIAFTPTAATSKLFLQLSLMGGSAGYRQGGYFYDSTGGAIIGPIGAAAGSRQRLTFGESDANGGSCSGMDFLAWFTPGDTTTRTIQVWAAAGGAGTLYINRNSTDTNNDNISHARSASTFTITEYDGSIVTIA